MECLLRSLGDVDIAVAEPDATARFLIEMLDFIDLGDHDGERRLALAGPYGAQTHRALPVLNILRRTEPGPLLRRVAWEIAPGSLSQMRTRLGEQGVDIVDAPQRQWDGPGLLVRDLDGLAVVLREPGTQPDIEVRPSTLRPRRMGHINIKVANAEAAADWYVSQLGFQWSERLGDLIMFLRFGEEHHRLGLRTSPSHDLESHHLAFEVPGWQYYLHFLDHLADNGHQIEYGPGRHNPGRNIFVYVRDPSSGMRIELFCDMYFIENPDTYEVKHWSDSDRFGGPDGPGTLNRWGPGPPPSFLE